MRNAESIMRVYFLHPFYHPAFSGHAIQLDRVRQRLRRHGLAMEVWTPRTDPGTPARETRDGVLVRRYGPPGTHRAARYLRRLHLMAWAAARLDAASVLHHAGLDTETRWAMVPAALLKRKQVAQMTLLHGDDPATLASAPPTQLFRRLFRRVDRWVALGTALKEAYLQTDLPRERLAVIPVAVDLARFKPPRDRSAVRRRLGLPENGSVVISVGDMVPRKGFDILVEAVPAVLEACPDTLFVIVGPLRHADPRLDAVRVTFHARLRRRIAELGVTSQIRFVGPQSNMPEWYQAADLMAFPSRSEGLPNSVMEAGAVGLPVVMADLGATSTDLIENGTTGYIVPQEDAGALAARIAELLQAPGRRNAMGRAARARVADRFDLDRVVDKYLALYRELLGDAVGTAPASKPPVPP